MDARCYWLPFYKFKLYIVSCDIQNYQMNRNNEFENIKTLQFEIG